MTRTSTPSQPTDIFERPSTPAKVFCGRRPSDELDLLRHVRIDSGLKGHDGYELWLFDSGKCDNRGQTIIDYLFLELTRPEARDAVIFAGSDFTGSPLHADDSDETLLSLLTFLTLRPGDIDDEYFAGYSEAQRAWAESYECETLACNVACYRDVLDNGPDGDVVGFFYEVIGGVE